MTAVRTGDQSGTDARNRKAALLSAGLVVGSLLAVVLATYFEPINLFALNLQGLAIGTTSVTVLSVGVVLSFVSGLTMIFTPCGLPLIFSLNSIATEGRERGRSWVPPMGLFTIGITSVMAAWGAVVALVGGSILDFVGGSFGGISVTVILYVTLGVLALVMALWEFGWVHLPRVSGSRALPTSLTRLGPYPRSFAMGAGLGGGFGVGCPFPTYQAVLAFAAIIGNPFFGALLLAANAVGRAAPLWLIGGLVYSGTDQRAVSRWLLGNSDRAKLVNGTGLAVFAGLMIILWGVAVPFVL
jgi:cytochrome c biogenesis protein CcdA